MKLTQPMLVRVVLGICALAAIRVFLFAAAFPFFNNVDEQAHVDLVVKYSHGDIPRGLGPYAPEAARYFAAFRTPEYFRKPEQYGGEYPPPNWQIPRDQFDKIISEEAPIWESRANHESGEPPLYYAVAGIWMDLGRACGLADLTLLYWVRFLNVVFAVSLVWLGYSAVRSIFPDNQFLQLGVPTLLAVWPQSAFFSVQADALSPVCFGLAFVAMIKILRSEDVSVVLPIGAGLALAATCLIKTSNLPLPLIALILLVLKIFAARKRQSIQKAFTTFAIVALSLAAPLAVWFGWNVKQFGDPTATKTKIELLGWTTKPLSEWLPHPIFTLNGFAGFWRELVASFWRGEFVWHLERMASGFADAFYAISSGLALTISLILLLRKDTGDEKQRWNLWLALVSFISLVAFMVLLSIKFDFGDSPYPSREHPYFVSGRLLNGAALPFFLLFVFVIDRIGEWSKREWVRWTLLGATALLLTVSQLQINAPAFSTRYNFFHRGPA